MKFSSQFFSENMLMSIGGHLVLIALMITSFVIVVDRAKMVAPDRIEIMEIDLNSVQVSGEETILYNINADQKPDKEEPAPTPEPQTKPAPQPVVPADDAPIETPSLIDQTPPTKEDTKPKPQEPQKTEKTDTPKKKKKTIVRVNREVVSLDRTLTVSVVDALRVAMTRCWNIDTKRDGISDIRAVAHMTMRRNGTVRDVWFESAAREQTDSAFAYVLETIRNAINVCQPFKMLPPGEFNKWEKIQLTFYPTQGKVM